MLRSQMRKARMEELERLMRQGRGKLPVATRRGRRTPRPNPHTVIGGVAHISLPCNLTALVDASDYHLVQAICWKVEKVPGGRLFYAIGDSGRVRMHHIIAGRKHVDHKNSNGLDNRRENLRPCTPYQNACNRRKMLMPCASQYKGVTFHKSGRSFIAKITANGKVHRLGCFPDEVAAARAYDAMAVKLHGEFARLNFPAGEVMPETQERGL